MRVCESELLVSVGGDDVLLCRYENPEVALNCGMMLRECVRHEPLAKIILHSELFYRFFSYVEMSTFDIASDAFATFKVPLPLPLLPILTPHLPTHPHSSPLCPHILPPPHPHSSPPHTPTHPVGFADKA